MKKKLYDLNLYLDEKRSNDKRIEFYKKVIEDIKGENNKELDFAK